MPQVQIARIKIDDSAVLRMVRVRDGTPAADGFRRAALIYRDWLRERYTRYAWGGGNWRKLSKEYRRRKKKMKHLILILDGNLRRGIKMRKSRRAGRPGYEVGYVTNERHPSYPGGVRKLAMIHQVEGVVRSDGIARRTIIVPPSATIRRQMNAAVNEGFRRGR